MIRLIVQTASTASMLALAALFVANPGRAAADDAEIDVGNLYFCDSSFQNGVCETTVSAGDTVTWAVSTGFHTVAQCNDDTFSGCPPAGGFDSGQLTGGDDYQQTFDTAGTYYYLCNNHPSQMRGIITVLTQETPTPTPSPTAAPTDSADPSPTPAPSVTATPASVPETGGEPGANTRGGLALAIAGAIAVAVAGIVVLRSLRRSVED